MAYTYELPNITGGLDSGIAGIVSTVPIFIPMFLFSIYCIILFGGIISQKSRTGTADIPMWSTLASLGTLLLALPMTIIPNIIEPITLIIIILITIISGVWLFLNERDWKEEKKMGKKKVKKKVTK